MGDRVLLLGGILFLGDRDLLLGDRDLLLGDRELLLGDRVLFLGDRVLLLGDRVLLLGDLALSVLRGDLDLLLLLSDRDLPLLLDDGDLLLFLVSCDLLFPNTGDLFLERHAPACFDGDASRRGVLCEMTRLLELSELCCWELRRGDLSLRLRHGEDDEVADLLRDLSCLLDADERENRPARLLLAVSLPGPARRRCLDGDDRR